MFEFRIKNKQFLVNIFRVSKSFSGFFLVCMCVSLFVCLFLFKCVPSITWEIHILKKYIYFLLEFKCN